MKNEHKSKVEKHEEDIDAKSSKNQEAKPDGQEANENEKMQEVLEKLQQKTKESEDYLDRLQRIAAEFENYKRRTTKEKEMIYKDSAADIISGFLPLLDNFERALCSFGGEDPTGIVEGIKMIQKQFKDLLHKYGVSEIEAVNHKFNPELHEAVIHIEDDNYEEGIVVEELRKGYKCGDKVLRHSMVKVAN
ncbi:MAG: nucleotide exchange factor GrpE [Deltaproteobacteria bacterium]